MTQEDINELLSKHPSPEAMIQFESRKKEAIERGCRCCDNAGFWDSDCFFDNHEPRARSSMSYQSSDINEVADAAKD